MAKFQVTVVPIEIEPHPKADRLELARVGGYRCVVGKGLYKTGDLVAYIPEQAILPDEVAEFLNIKGKLAGPEANRVHPVKLRGIISQGVTYPARPEWVEGQDVAEILGITKHVPEIPEELSGASWAAGLDLVIRYDVENRKRYPDMFEDGEGVVITEKLHGTFAEYGLVPDADPEWGAFIVTSKGMADSGLAFQVWSKADLDKFEAESKAEKEAREVVRAARAAAREAGEPEPDTPMPDKVFRPSDNYYLRAARHFDLEGRIQRAQAKMAGVLGQQEYIFVIGEVIGAGIQKGGMHYGSNAGEDDQIGFRVFDIYVGPPKLGRFLNDDELDAACKALDLERVPVLYRGPYSDEVVGNLVKGMETVTGKNRHIREGVVIRPRVERQDDRIGRVQLKAINPKYLLKTDGEELQ